MARKHLPGNFLWPSSAQAPSPKLWGEECSKVFCAKSVLWSSTSRGLWASPSERGLFADTSQPVPSASPNQTGMCLTSHIYLARGFVRILVGREWDQETRCLFTYLFLTQRQGSLATLSFHIFSLKMVAPQASFRKIFKIIHCHFTKFSKNLGTTNGYHHGCVFPCSFACPLYVLRIFNHNENMLLYHVYLLSKAPICVNT